jgi:hypothetical protein
MTGYSGTPLAQKLGIKEGSRVLVIDDPGAFIEWLAPVPEDVVIGARLRKADVVVVFCRNSSDLKRGLARALRAIPPDGSVWVAWPKKSSGVVSDLQSREVMLSIMFPEGLVDVKVGAISEVWSGLKFVVRREHRASWPSRRASG